MIPETEYGGRYDYLLDPSDRYVVWDRMTDLPAMCASGILAFATAEEAATAIRRLNHRPSPEDVSNDSALCRRCASPPARRR